MNTRDRIDFMEIFAILRNSGRISELEEEMYKQKRSKIFQIIGEMQADKKDDYLESLQEALFRRKTIEPYELEYVQEKYNEFIRTHPTQKNDTHNEESLNVLKMRLAKGEISVSEFNELKKIIET